MMRLNKVAALALVALAADAFPMQVTLFANQSVPGVEPETNAYAEPYGRCDVIVKDHDQLVRVLSNVEALNELHQRIADGGLWLELPIDGPDLLQAVVEANGQQPQEPPPPAPDAPPPPPAAPESAQAPAAPPAPDAPPPPPAAPASTKKAGK